MHRGLERAVAPHPPVPMITASRWGWTNTCTQRSVFFSTGQEGIKSVAPVWPTSSRRHKHIICTWDSQFNLDRSIFTSIAGRPIHAPIYSFVASMNEHLWWMEITLYIHFSSTIILYIAPLRFIHENLRRIGELSKLIGPSVQKENVLQNVLQGTSAPWVGINRCRGWSFRPLIRRRKMTLQLQPEISMIPCAK